MNWIITFFRRKKVIPEPIVTHGLSMFWRNHGYPEKLGTEIEVKMESKKIAVYKLVKKEYAAGVDWKWYTFNFVRYLPENKT